MSPVARVTCVSSPLLLPESRRLPLLMRAQDETRKRDDARDGRQALLGIRVWRRSRMTHDPSSGLKADVNYVQRQSASQTQE